MEKVILSLGSSLGNRLNNLNTAISLINRDIGEVKKISGFYETEPWGFEDDNFFLNCAISLYSKQNPFEILQAIQKIESSLKRKRTKNSYEARTIDIDIIYYGNKIYIDEKLQIPHKFAHKRSFVLKPLCDIEPDFKHPVFQLTTCQLLEKCEDKTLIQQIEK